MGKKKIDLTGKQYGRLLVIRDVLERKHKEVCWLCRCVCGNEIIVLGSSLRIGNTKSCGCYARERKSEIRIIDMIGKSFHKLIVIKQAKHRIRRSGKRRLRWLCQCDCGQTTTVLGESLRSGHTKSCGCFHTESLTGCNHPNWKGGVTPGIKRVRNSKEYKQWRTSAFARDNYQCKYCSKTGKGLCVHHIDSFADFPEIRFLIENGITLCKKCHQKYHKLYGVLHANRADLKEFMLTKPDIYRTLQV